MTTKWILLAMLAFAVTKTAKASIVGVTYQDHFDFEQRYSNPNECNPFYYHPLHLPPECSEMFEKAIRKRIARNGPMKLMLKPKRTRTRQYHYTNYDKRLHQSYDVYVPDISDEIESYKIDEILTNGQERNLNPYEQMMELLRNDVSYLPTAPKVVPMPGLGVVALYEQPISKQSVSLIKKVSKMYAKNSKKNVYPYPYSYPLVSEVILKYQDDGGKDKEEKNKVDET